MIVRFRERTLWDAIAPYEDEFRRVLREAIEHALVSLGDDIYKMDWCNVLVSMANRTDRGRPHVCELKEAA